MGALSEAAYTVISLAILGAPILVFVIWIMKVYGEKTSCPRWRAILLWLSLVAVTISIGFAWSGVISRPGNVGEISHLTLRIRSQSVLR